MTAEVRYETTPSNENPNRERTQMPNNDNQMSEIAQAIFEFYMRTIEEDIEQALREITQANKPFEESSTNGTE